MDTETLNSGRGLTGDTTQTEPAKVIAPYTPNRAGFFLFPVDFGSNNLRVFVISPSVKAMRFL
jgi:hypothetical protein